MTATTQHWTVSVTPRPEIRVNQHFGLVVKVRDKTGEAPKRVRVDADMPSHKHGMNTEPRITAQQDGSWLVEGMLFHMPGAWELYVYIGEGTALECATFGVDL